MRFQSMLDNVPSWNSYIFTRLTFYESPTGLLIPHCPIAGLFIIPAIDFRLEQWN